MAYGLIRVRNLSAGELRPTEIHNFRLYDELGMETPENIFPEKDTEKLTRSIVFSQGKQSNNSTTKELNNRMQELGINPRKNSVMAIEYAVGASAEYFEKGGDTSLFLEKAVNFVSKIHGKENVLSVSFHYDEGNPHAHVIVIPIVEKAVKWKNKRGSGERMEKRLCAREFTGGPEKLVKLQDQYHEFCQQFNFTKNVDGQLTGVKFFRGTKASEQLKHYTKQTNHEIGILRHEISITSKLSDIVAHNIALDDLKAHMVKKTTQLQQRVEIKKEKNGKNDKNGLPNWKKGEDFGRGF